MCKVVYLTNRRFCRQASEFRKALAEELRKRKIEVVEDNAIDLFNLFRRHKIYGIALAFDFYEDGESGCGLMLNKNCSLICRDFSYNLSSAVDSLMPMVQWREFDIVSSDNKLWSRFFKGVSSTTKAVFYLCNRKISSDMDYFYTVRDEIIKKFAEEIVRCLRSDYDIDAYRKRVKAIKFMNNGNKKLKEE